VESHAIDGGPQAPLQVDELEAAQNATREHACYVAGEAFLSGVKLLDRVPGPVRLVLDSRTPILGAAMRSHIEKWGPK
jgi:hypothetical protein